MSQRSDFKIKRHKRVYQNAVFRRIGAFKMAGGILLLCALFFVGYSVAEPVMSFLSGDMRKRIEDERNSSSQAPQQSSTPVSSETSGSADTLSFDEIHALYMPGMVFSDDTRFEAFVAQAKALGANTVVMELKDDFGVIYYDSEFAQAGEIGAVMEDAPKLRARIRQLTEQGIQAVAQMHVFKDPLAARKIKGAAVRYSKDVTTTWLDNYATEGGKPWLNPESTEGMAYLSGIVQEIAESGASYILLNSLNYPTGVGLNLAYFGPKSNDSRLGVLNTCLAQLQGAVQQTQTGLIVSYPASAYLSGNEQVYGADPARLNADMIAPVLLPDDFSGEITIGKTRIADPVAQAYDLSRAFGEALRAGVPAATGILPVVSKAPAQRTAFEELGIAPYVIYSADGKYE